MSRSAGSFADFFPAAPSVIQQKQKKAALGHQQRKPRSSESSRAEDNHVNGSSRSPHPTATQPSLARLAASLTDHAADDEDKSQLNGELRDMLDGVGSASSLNSVVSSVFSNSAPTENAMHHTTGIGSLALTPLTIVESSPPEKAPSPQKDAIKPTKSLTNGGASSGRQESDNAAAISHTNAAIERTRFHKRLLPRPGTGKVKGVRTVYDPELDHKLATKDKKTVKPRYKQFGEEVCGQGRCTVQT